MITTKHVRCCRWTWGAITRCPHSTILDLARTQTDYSKDEIKLALSDLEAQGYIQNEKQDTHGGYRGYVALVRFVIVAPAWAVQN